jgi:hypothetical protein
MVLQALLVLESRLQGELQALQEQAEQPEQADLRQLEE